jgi:predicted porin
MKKVMFTLGLLLVGLASQAQDLSKHAIGLRLGDNDGLGYEISYQRALSDSNRLQFDLGWRSRDNEDAYKLTGIYQWVWDLSGLAPGFNWFAGAGGGVGAADNKTEGSTTFVNAAGNVGIEYNFDFPLQLSLDTRPEIGIINGGDDLALEIALGVRYKF